MEDACSAAAATCGGTEPEPPLCCIMVNLSNGRLRCKLENTRMLIVSKEPIGIYWLTFKKGTRYGCGAELSSICNCCVKCSGSILSSIRFCTSFLTLLTVVGDWPPVDASFIKVVRKFRHLVTLTTSSCEGKSSISIMQWHHEKIQLM